MIDKIKPTPFSLLLFISLLMFTLPHQVLADQVTMKNGDVITGKVSSVEKSKVTITPSYAGKIQIKLSDIRSIMTDEPLELELSDGEVVKARFAGIKEDQHVMLVGDKESTIEVEQLKKAKRPEPFYYRESKAEGLLTMNEGNTVNQSAAFTIDTLLRLGKHRQYAVLAMQRDSNEDVDTKKQDLFRHEYNWLYDEDWYIGTTTAFERDPIRDLSYRFTFGALLGHDFIDDGRNFLTLKGGMGYTDEKLGESPSQGPVGLWELDLRLKPHGFDMELFHKNTLTYQHYGDRNLIANTSTGLKMDVMWDIYATATYRYNYETEPAPTKLNRDSTLGVGLGVKF